MHASAGDESFRDKAASQSEKAGRGTEFGGGQEDQQQTKGGGRGIFRETQGNIRKRFTTDH